MSNPEQAFMKCFLKSGKLNEVNSLYRSIAIVDENPQSQYMLPEFILFKNCLNNITSSLLSATLLNLFITTQALWHGNQTYRSCLQSTDRFPDWKRRRISLYLEAYLSKSVVVTPQSRAHATLCRQKKPDTTD